MPQLSPDFDVISNQKRFSIFRILICQCHFDGPSEAHGPHDGPLKPMGPLMDPLSPWEPGSLPPLSVALFSIHLAPGSPRGEGRGDNDPGAHGV